MSVPNTTNASELGEFNALVADALDHYRAARFYLHNNNPSVAAFELKRMQGKWQTVLERFADSPPDAFADDPKWGESLKQVADNLNRALVAANAAKVEAGKERLAAIREELAGLRKRNSIWIFSDRVDELNAAVDRLSVYIEQSPDFGSMEQVNAIKTATAVVAYLTEKCRDEAPQDYRQHEAFQQLIDDTLEAIDKLVKAVDRKDKREMTGYIRIIRSHSRMLFLRYG